MHVPLLIESVTRHSATLAQALVKQGVFEPNEIQFLTKNHGVYTKRSYKEHDLGLSRDTFEEAIDLQLRRYAHFSSHKIVKYDEEAAYTVEGDRPIQAFTYEKLVLTRPTQTNYPLGY